MLLKEKYKVLLPSEITSGTSTEVVFEGPEVVFPLSLPLPFEGPAVADLSMSVIVMHVDGHSHALDAQVCVCAFCLPLRPLVAMAYNEYEYDL